MDIREYRTEIQKLVGQIQQKFEALSEDTVILCEKLEKYGELQREDALIGYACFVRGQYYYMKNDMLNFYREMLRCMRPFENIGEWGYLAVANNLLGIMSLNRGNAPFAMDYYSRALTLCRQYKLPDIEWQIHMNMGALFINVESFENALKHYDLAYQYICMHKELPEYRISMTASLVGLGRAHLSMEHMEEAEECRQKLERECLPYLREIDQLPVYCLLARFYQKTSALEKCQNALKKVSDLFSEDLPIMDVYDDLYDYLMILLETDDYDLFSKMITPITELTRKTTIRNLEQKQVRLLLRYYKMRGDDNHYAQAAVRSVALDEMMEQENKMMVKSMIGLRLEFNELAIVNHQIEEENKTLQIRSQTDPLTGMYNRLRLNSYGETAFERAEKNQVGLAVEILDIDFFKEYNDNYGHQAGDKVIQFIAASIKKMQLGNRVFAARYGGDEFVLIYEGYTDEEVFELAKRLKTIISTEKMPHRYSRTETKYITISQGLYWGVPREGASIWQYLHEADNMLYKVKSRSRNSIMLGHANEEEIKRNSDYLDRKNLVVRSATDEEIFHDD